MIRSSGNSISLISSAPSLSAQVTDGGGASSNEWEVQSNLICFQSTGLSKRNGAKLRELSLNFSKLADWLCIGWPSCLAALRREFSNRETFLLHHPVHRFSEYGTTYQMSWANSHTNRLPAKQSLQTISHIIWYALGERRNAKTVLSDRDCLIQ